MNHRRRILSRNLTAAVLLITFILASCGVNREVSTKVLRKEIKYLSSDDLQGRLTGSPGDSLAALFIKNKLESYGLKPLKGDGFQRFKVPQSTIPGKDNFLSVDSKAYVSGTDFMPMGFSSNAGLNADVVFAGYGFSINEDSLKWNDYKDIDVKGKWVLILRSDPESDNIRSPFTRYSSDRDKALMAKDMGAAGVLLVSGPAHDSTDVLESPKAIEYQVGIPVLRIKRSVAEALFGSSRNIASIEHSLDKNRAPESFTTGISANGKADLVRLYSSTRNVAMVLPGDDRNLAGEYVVFGAHFDHLGLGGPGSGSRAVDTVGVHHGADDNASGIAMMLELVRKFSKTPGSHARSIVCVAFTGEEEGLLGSKYFTDNPLLDLSKVNAMINMDMVGRLNETKNLQISGVGTAAGLKELVLSHSDTSQIKLTLSNEGYGPSDHSSFYGKNIPVLFYFTGAHLDYHTPADTWDKINYDGMSAISKLIFPVAEQLSNNPERLKFKESGPKVETSTAVRRRGVTLGIMPDFAGVVKNGLRADFITPGKPAALGGMKKGDIITAINGKSVNNIEDYMFRLSQLKHGETISVEVIRNDKKIVLLIQL